MRRLTALTLLALIAGCGSGERPAPRQDTGGWEQLTAAPLQRTEVAVARVGRFAYVIGGFEEESGATTAAVERYDLAADAWSEVAPLPIGVNHAGATAVAGRVYVLGGYTGRSSLDDETARLYRYDPVDDRWTRLPDAPTARGALGLAAVGRKLYAVGGKRTGSGPLRRVEIYDIATRKWRRGPSLRVGREHLAVTASGGKVYALAGREGGIGTNFATVERYTPGRRRWTTLASMGTPRGGIAAAPVPGGRVVVVGGEEQAGTIAAVELYEPGTDSWRRLDDLPTPRHGLGAVFHRGRVFVIAGGDQPGLHFTGAVEALRIAP